MRKLIFNKICPTRKFFSSFHFPNEKKKHPANFYLVRLCGRQDNRSVGREGEEKIFFVYLPRFIRPIGNDRNQSTSNQRPAREPIPSTSDPLGEEPQRRNNQIRRNRSIRVMRSFHFGLGMDFLFRKQWSKNSIHGRKKIYKGRYYYLFSNFYFFSFSSISPKDGSHEPPEKNSRTHRE